jgi:hypothetical protein
MYSASTFELSRATGVLLVLPVARWFGYAALGVWTVVAFGLARSLLSPVGRVRFSRR